MTSAYSYNPDTDTEYYCSIPVISVKEQFNMITESFEKFKDQLTESETERLQKCKENQDRYAGDYEFLKKNIVAGFCKSANHIGRHADAPFTPHNCRDCAAEWLVRSRICFKGTSLIIDFQHENNDPDQHENTDPDHCLNVGENWESNAIVQIEKGVATVLLNREQILQTRDFELLVNHGSCPTFKLKSAVWYNNQQLIGKIGGRLKGIPICKSLLYGDTCQSMTGKRTTFTTSCVPKGYANWTENNTKTNSNGDIYIHPSCWACVKLNPRSASAKLKNKNRHYSGQDSKSPSPRLFNASPADSINNLQDAMNEIERLRMSIQIHKEQMNVITQTVINDRIQIQELKSENIRLKQAYHKNQLIKQQNNSHVVKKAENTSDTLPKFI